MFTRRVKVMPSDVGYDGHMKLRCILDCFQDTAAMAFEGVEGTSTQLLARGYAWVLTRYEIDIHGELPGLDDEFDLHTWHDPNHGYNTLRMFQSHFITAKSSWLLVDVKAGRPVKALAHIPGINSQDSDTVSPSFREIPSFTEPSYAVNITVKPHDLDYNSHVNNAIYFAWIEDNLPVQGKIARINASFRSGAKLGENVTLEYCGDMCRVIRPGISRPCAEFLIIRR